MTITNINPANNETVSTHPMIGEDEVMDRIAKASLAFEKLRETSFDERSKAMRAVANALRADCVTYAELITADMGKRLCEARDEIEYCADIADYYAENAKRFLADQPFDDVKADAYLRHEPLGVLLGVMPWNFPFYQVVRFAAPNLMAGNPVLIKHAKIVPQCATALLDLFAGCGLPDGSYANLFISSELVEPIVADDRVRGVSLTGGEKAGAAVATLAGKYLKRSVLELGGNDPFIVLEDADLDSAADHAVAGRTVNAGQSCVASKRFIIVDEVYDEFLDRFRGEMQSLTIGDPRNEETTLGPLSSESAVEQLEAQVESAVQDGAMIELGGRRPDRAGAFYEPTILSGVTPDVEIFDQELFGPVAVVYRVADEREAIELANSSSYGLGGSVFTADRDRGKRIAERIETGMVFVNQPTESQAELPFGGVKNSGYGRELSHLGILEFVNKKLVHLSLD